MIGPSLTKPVQRIVRSIVCVAAAAIMVFALSSCATMTAPLKESSVSAITDALNNGSAQKLVHMSFHAFAFDSEVFDRGEDITALWHGLVKAGLKAQPGQPTDSPVTAASYTLFADSTMMKLFFKRYVPADARILQIPTNLGELMILAANSKTAEPVIFGIAGPER